MTTFYIENKGSIELHDTDKNRLENSIRLMPQFAGSTISETELEIIDGNFVGSKEHFEKLKASKLAKLNMAFNIELENAHCMSAAGFEINADESANRNVTDLIQFMLDTDTKIMQFRDYDNIFHAVTFEQLKIIKTEIVSHKMASYNRKWAVYDRISKASSLEELNLAYDMP